MYLKRNIIYNLVVDLFDSKNIVWNERKAKVWVEELAYYEATDITNSLHKEIISVDSFTNVGKVLKNMPELFETKIKRMVREYRQKLMNTEMNKYKNLPKEEVMINDWTDKKKQQIDGDR